jgi:hypothetical protein
MPVRLIDGHTNFFDVGFEVFGHKVSIMFCDDVKREMIALHPEVGQIDDAEALCYMYKRAAMAEIFVKFNAKIGSISHEAFHAIWHLFEYHGMKKDDEGMAYHLGYLVEEIVGAQIQALEAKNAATERELQRQELEGSCIIYGLL